MEHSIALGGRQPAYTLSGKTGTAPPTPDGYLAWFVGYVESPDGTTVFALNLSCEDYSSYDHLSRRETAVEILTDRGLLPTKDTAGGD